MRNQVARHMNTFNKNSVHADRKKLFSVDSDYSIVEGLHEYQEEAEMTAHWLKNLHSNATLKNNSKTVVPQELIEKYQKDCLSLLPPETVLEITQMVGDESHPIHLLWMLKQISEDSSMSDTKCHRWLGYIQGVLYMKGLYTIQEEREYTRLLLNGS